MLNDKIFNTVPNVVFCLFLVAPHSLRDPSSPTRTQSWAES